MNIKEYISSGIVESYVLGLASKEERLEFEQLCTKYPELINARNIFESELEKQAFTHAIEPPLQLKQGVLSSLDISAPVVPIRSGRRFNELRIAIAACLILLAGSILMNIILSGRNTRLARINKEQKQQYDDMAGTMKEMKSDMKVLQQNPSIKMASLKGMDISPQSLTTVYWDTTSHNVYLLINNLPTPPSDKQYQVWALLDGKPIDLGMIDNNWFVSQKRLLLKAQNVEKAQAFAITLEDMGGHPEPKGQIYVKGAPL